MQPSWKFKSLICSIFILALVSLAGPAGAGIESKSLKKVKLTDQALDITTSSDGKLIFALTPGKILVYSTVENAIIDRISVDKNYTRISWSTEERLILSAADPSTLEILKYDQVFDINLTNRPFRGPQDAKVTLVVFDDYQ